MKREILCRPERIHSQVLLGPHASSVHEVSRYGVRKMRVLSGSVPTPLLLCLENTGWGNQVQLVDTRFTNRSSSVMAGTAMPRSHRGTGVSPVTDWVVYGYSL